MLDIPRCGIEWIQ